MCGGSILSCCPRNPHGHEWALKEEEELFKFSRHVEKSFFTSVVKIVPIGQIEFK